MRVFYFLLVWLLCIAGILHAQPVNVVGVSVTGRFNSCSGGSNLPTVTANLISTGSGSSVSSGVFQCNNRCDSSKIRVTISGIRWNKSPNAEWLHGLFLPANAGFSVTPVSVPPGFITYNPGCVGTCPSGSGTNGGPGFYFDNTTGNSCCGTVTANDGFPCNNYGDVTIDCGGSFSISFDMTFCNSIITSGFYQFIFTGTSDGETGCYNFNDMLPHHIAFTIMTQPCSLPVMNLSASVPERHCTGSLVNYTSTLTGTCTGNTIFWWDAPTGGNLLGSGSPFVFDPAGSACPAGTTLYATCCPGSNTICVLREPVTIPGTCLPLQIDSVSKSNGVCGQPGAINAVFLSNTQGIVNYTLQPGGITNTTGIFPNLTQTQYTLQVTDASQCTVSTVISISQSTAVQLGAPQMTSPDCINPFSGSITVVANGGTTPYLYSISPTATQSSPGVFTSLNSQSYTIQVSDNTGCSSSMVVVLQPSLSPVFSSILITPPLCYGDQNASIQATATGGSGTLTYTLQPALLSNTSGQFLNLTSGVYQITCTDTMGCSHDSTITINDPLPLQLSTLNSTPVSCSYLSDGSIQCTGTGGTGNYTYHLNPGAINNTTGYYGNLASGLYTLTLSDGNNCSYTQTVWVDSVPILGILQLQGINATCFGSNNASIQVQGTGGTAPYIYTVNPGAASSSSGFFNGLGSGIYTLQIHDQHNCLYTDSIQLISPPAMVWQNTQFTHPNCAGTNTGSIVVQATGGSGSIQYQLMPGGLNSTTGNFTMLNAGFYTVTAIDANNCLLTTVFQLVSPTVLQWTLNSSTDVSCFGQANGIIEVQASGGTGILNYQLWMPLQNNSSGLFNSLNPATYSVQVTDANGCSLQTTLLISEPAPLQFTNTTLFIPACFGNSNGSIQTNGSGGTTPYSFTLLPSSFQNNTGLFNSLSAGNYTIQLSDWNGCTNDTTIQIVNPLPLVLDSVEVQTTTCLPGNDGIITIWASGGNAPLQYSHGGPFQTSNQFSSMNSGSYTLTVLDANGCSITSVQTLQTPNAPQILQVYTDSVTCHGYSDGSVQVVAGGGSGLLTYTIQPGTIINSTGLFSLLSGGLYTVSVKDSLPRDNLFGNLVHVWLYDP
ncbi:MAG TPA: SprB repeat-containing protein, partial [Chitinophagaceae bacterium]|nr:SprB repeat-containing protein [Chitinophagaceae bacterium]